MDMNYVTQEELQAALEHLNERTMVEIHNAVLRVRLERTLDENADLRKREENLQAKVDQMAGDLADLGRLAPSPALRPQREVRPDQETADIGAPAWMELPLMEAEGS